MAERSVSAAAVRLGLSQPAMSSILRKLRALFDDELFVRSGRAMLPTVRALQIEAPITQALAQIRTALEPQSPFAPATSRRIFNNISGGDYATMMTPSAPRRPCCRRGPLRGPSVSFHRKKCRAGLSRYRCAGSCLRRFSKSSQTNGVTAVVRRTVRLCDTTQQPWPKGWDDARRLRRVAAFARHGSGAMRSVPWTRRWRNAGESAGLP